MSDTTTLRWGDPPAAKSAAPGRKWGPIFSALAERPGEWALVVEGGHLSTRTNIVRGVLGGTDFPAGSIEAVARNRRVVDGKTVYDIYARAVAG